MSFWLENANCARQRKAIRIYIISANYRLYFYSLMIVEYIQFNISHVPQVLIWFQGFFYACIQPCVSPDNNCCSIRSRFWHQTCANFDILETSESNFSSCIVGAVVPHHLCYPVGPHESHQPCNMHFIFTPILCCITLHCYYSETLCAKHLRVALPSSLFKLWCETQNHSQLLLHQMDNLFYFFVVDMDS